MSSRYHLPERSYLLYGLGVTNRAVALALRSRGATVVLADDGDASQLDAVASELDVTRVEHAPDAARVDAVLRTVEAVVPAPGLPEHHHLFDRLARQRVPVLSEFDLAGAWDERPVAAVTGTNGKTTVTMLATSMLVRSGVRACAAGNLETPLVAAIDDPEPEVFVVEASSFRLARSRRFRPAVGTWLNFAEDHLDVHRTLEDYRAAKARIWSDQGVGDVAVANADDATVAAAARALTGPQVTWFGLHGNLGGHALDYLVSGEQLVARGEPVVGVDELWSPLEHDRSNALAAMATAAPLGATTAGMAAAAAEFDGLAHRVELVAESGGVRWFDDSKATAPHATLAAVRGFDSVVLIAGGRNKGMDLSVLAEIAPRLRAVVAIGESAAEVRDALPDVPAEVAGSMEEAVRSADAIARHGDVVLLSPACASFDWYSSYAERGEDFARCVRQVAGSLR